MNAVKAVVNGNLVLEREIVSGQVLLYEGDTIRDIMGQRFFRPRMCEEVIDATGCFVTAGFINEHIHGCGGADAMDEADHALETMAALLPQTGVTAFLPTTMTYERSRIEAALTRIRTARCKKPQGARILGAHMEGPFINEQYKGAQEAAAIAKADISLIEDYGDIIKIITLAPETIDDKTFFALCRDKDIVVSVGHSMATYEEMAGMADCGVYHVTHLFNAMPAFHHRQPGLIGAALTDDRAHCELICDNIHVHRTAQVLAYKAKGRDGLILITDSLRACLMGDGLFELGGREVLVRDGRARLADGTLAGSIVTMDRAVFNFLVNTGAPLPDVIAMATINPARDLGVAERLGSLEKGKQADITFLDDGDLHVRRTIVAGETVYMETP